MQTKTKPQIKALALFLLIGITNLEAAHSTGLFGCRYSSDNKVVVLCARTSTPEAARDIVAAYRQMNPLSFVPKKSVCGRIQISFNDCSIIINGQ